MEKLGVEGSIPETVTPLIYNELRQQAGDGGSRNGSSSEFPPDLRRIIASWPFLPSEVKQTVLTLVKHSCRQTVVQSWQHVPQPLETACDWSVRAIHILPILTPDSIFPPSSGYRNNCQWFRYRRFGANGQNRKDNTALRHRPSYPRCLKCCTVASYLIRIALPRQQAITGQTLSLR